MHRSSIVSSLSLYALSLVMGGPSGLQAGPLFSITTLGDLGSGEALPLALNNSGTAVGFYTDASGYADPVSLNGTRTQLGTNGVATGINNAGIVIGYSYTGSSSTVTEWSAGQPSSLGITGVGTAINNSGEIAGAYQFSSTQMHAFTQQNGVMKDLGTLGGSWSAAYALNDSGTAAGTSTMSNGHYAACVTSGKNLQNLGTLGGNNSYGMAISQNGMVAGTSQNSAGYLRAFLSTGGVMHDLGTLGGSISSATGVNSAGWVVGSSTTSGNMSTDGFLSMNGSMFDLNSLLPIGTGWTITGAYAINDGNDILASAIAGGENYAVELTPNGIISAAGQLASVPEPAALAITALGLIVLSRVSRRHKRARV